MVKKINVRQPSRYDDIEKWVEGGFESPPWSVEAIASFQKRIDSAFGGENCIVLAWSGDRSYGDQFYTDWHVTGMPKGKPERKPVLLFGEFPISETDYVYVVPPRWLLMEVHHGSQLEASWESSAWVSDPTMLTGRKRIRTAKPPEFYYVPWRTIARHEGGANDWSLKNPCCSRLWYGKKKICYGSYRDPDGSDIAFVGATQANMSKAGVAQRNDTQRDANVVLQGGLATRHFMKRAEQQRAVAAKEFMLANVPLLCGDILKSRGSTMSVGEMERIVAEGLDEQENERFSKE